MSVGIARALHIAFDAKQRAHAHEQRAKFLRQVAALSINPRSRTTLAIPMNEAEIHAGTERVALIGPPDEIIGRLKALERQGVEYVLLIDVSGDRQALRMFAREVMPEFSGAAGRIPATA